MGAKIIKGTGRKFLCGLLFIFIIVTFAVFFRLNPTKTAYAEKCSGASSRTVTGVHGSGTHDTIRHSWTETRSCNASMGTWGSWSVSSHSAPKANLQCSGDSSDTQNRTGVHGSGTHDTVRHTWKERRTRTCNHSTGSWSKWSGWSVVSHSAPKANLQCSGSATDTQVRTGVHGSGTHDTVRHSWTETRTRDCNHSTGSWSKWSSWKPKSHSAPAAPPPTRATTTTPTTTAEDIRLGTQNKAASTPRTRATTTTPTRTAEDIRLGTQNQAANDRAAEAARLRQAELRARRLGDIPAATPTRTAEDIRLGTQNQAAVSDQEAAEERRRAANFEQTQREIANRRAVYDFNQQQEQEKARNAYDKIHGEGAYDRLMKSLEQEDDRRVTQSVATQRAAYDKVHGAGSYDKEVARVRKESEERERTAYEATYGKGSYDEKKRIEAESAASGSDYYQYIQRNVGKTYTTYTPPATPSQPENLSLLDRALNIVAVANPVSLLAYAAGTVAGGGTVSDIFDPEFFNSTVTNSTTLRTDMRSTFVNTVSTIIDTPRAAISVPVYVIADTLGRCAGGDCTIDKNIVGTAVSQVGIGRASNLAQIQRTGYEAGMNSSNPLQQFITYVATTPAAALAERAPNVYGTVASAVTNPFELYLIAAGGGPGITQAAQGISRSGVAIYGTTARVSALARVGARAAVRESGETMVREVLRTNSQFAFRTPGVGTAIRGGVNAVRSEVLNRQTVNLIGRYVRTSIVEQAPKNGVDLVLTIDDAQDTAHAVQVISGDGPLGTKIEAIAADWIAW